MEQGVDGTPSPPAAARTPDMTKEQQESFVANFFAKTPAKEELDLSTRLQNVTIRDRSVNAEEYSTPGITTYVCTSKLLL